MLVVIRKMGAFKVTPICAILNCMSVSSLCATGIKRSRIFYQRTHPLPKYQFLEILPRPLITISGLGKISHKIYRNQTFL